MTQRHRTRILFVSLGVTALLMTGCGILDLPGDSGDPNNMEDSQPLLAPATPTRLRVFPGGLPPEYELRWTQPAGNVPAASFIVYAADSPITEPSDDLMYAVVDGSTPSATIELLPDTGFRYFRVSAVSALGVESALSSPYTVNTTTRVAFTETDVNDVVELFFASPDAGRPAAVTGDIADGATGAAGLKWSPNGTQVAFIADKEMPDRFELFVTNGATRPDVLSPDSLVSQKAQVVFFGPHKVSGDMVDGGRVVSAAWSPDATRLAFAAEWETPGVTELYVVSASGFAEPIKVSAPLPPEHDVTVIKWSPDGERLAYLVATEGDPNVDDDGASELYVTSANGDADAVRVSVSTADGGRVQSFGFSPDGQSLGFVNSIVYGDGPELFVFDLTRGSEATSITGDAFAQGGVYAMTWMWSADGTQLAFVATEAKTERPDLYVMPAGGDGDPVKISGTLAASARIENAPALWSPDAARIAFAAVDADSAARELYVSNALPGAEPVKVSGSMVEDGDLARGSAAWSPTGERLLFVADKEVDGLDELYVANPAGGEEPLKVSGDLVDGGGVSAARWSPDGTRIAFLAEKDTVDVRELYVTPADGSADPERISTGGVVHAFGWSPLSNRLDPPACGNDLSLLPLGGLAFLTLGFARIRGRNSVSPCPKRQKRL